MDSSPDFCFHCTCELNSIFRLSSGMSEKQTVIVTGASQGIGAGLVDAFLKEGYNVVATALDVSHKVTASPKLVLVDGDIGKQETAAKVFEAAITNFGAIDTLVTNAGLFYKKSFTDFTTQDVDSLISTNLLGFLYITQLTVRQMLKQKSGSVVSISAALADRPIAGVNGSVSMMTKGGLNSVIQNLAVEYAEEGLRFNAVAPGQVDTPMHRNNPQDSIETAHSTRKIGTIKDVVDAVIYLSQADHVSGEILHVDGGGPVRRW